MDLQALKLGYTLGKIKPVKAKLVDRKIDLMWEKLDNGLVTISQFLEFGCNFFEPDRELERPAFDSSAVGRRARPSGMASGIRLR